MSFTQDKDSDNYATDKKGWEIIEPYIPKDKVIWSPFYCDGKQKEYFEEMGYKVFLLKGFTNLFKDELQIIIPTKRPTFTHLINPKKNYTPPFGVWYFCYKMNLEKDLIFID